VVKREITNSPWILGKDDESADEVSEINDDASPAGISNHLATPLSAQAAMLVETKDIARLKHTIADLEKKLKSR